MPRVYNNESEIINHENGAKFNNCRYVTNHGNKCTFNSCYAVGNHGNGCTFNTCTNVMTYGKQCMMNSCTNSSDHGSDTRYSGGVVVAKPTTHKRPLPSGATTVTTIRDGFGNVTNIFGGGGGVPNHGAPNSGCVRIGGFDVGSIGVIGGGSINGVQLPPHVTLINMQPHFRGRPFGWGNKRLLELNPELVVFLTDFIGPEPVAPPAAAAAPPAAAPAPPAAAAAPAPPAAAAAAVPVDVIEIHHTLDDEAILVAATEAEKLELAQVKAAIEEHDRRTAEARARANAAIEAEDRRVAEEFARRWEALGDNNDEEDDDDDNEEDEEEEEEEEAHRPEPPAKRRRQQTQKELPRLPPAVTNEPSAPAGADTCVVCFDRERCVIFLDCGHDVACVTCAHTIESTAKREGTPAKCPICKAPYKRVVRRYKS